MKSDGWVPVAVRPLEHVPQKLKDFCEEKKENLHQLVDSEHFPSNPGLNEGGWNGQRREPFATLGIIAWIRTPAESW
jgi:hypothetical protein